MRNSAGPAVASALLAIVLYAITLGGGYVYDDVQIVQKDPRVHQPTEWIRLWTGDYFDGGIDNLYRPITSSSYALEWWLHGDRPWIFHGVNILLNAWAAAALAEFTRRALEKTSIAHFTAYAAGMLFAAHPVHAEAVANIVGRAEVLVTSLIFSGLILLLHRPLTLPRVGGVIGVGIVAVLCKEQGILQPLNWLLFGLILWPTRKPKHHPPVIHTTEIAPSSQLNYATAYPPDPVAREKFAVKILVLLTSWIWAGYLVAREHYLKFEWNRADIDPIVQPLALSHGLDRLLMPIVLLGHYTALLFWPAHFAVDYGGKVFGSVALLADPYLWLGTLMIALWFISTASLLTFLFSASLRLRGSNSSREHRKYTNTHPIPELLLFCLFCLAITYGMIGNILTLIATNFGERLIYLPSAFFLIIVAVLIAHLRPKPRMALLTIMLMLMSIRTIAAARDWNYPLTLYEHGLANQPRSAQLHLLLSQQYQLAGNHPAAIKLLREATDLYPQYWRTWMFRADEDMNIGDLTDATDCLKRAIKLKADGALIEESGRLAKLKSNRETPIRLPMPHMTR